MDITVSEQYITQTNKPLEVNMSIDMKMYTTGKKYNNLASTLTFACIYVN